MYKYIADYSKNEEVKLDADKISKNHALHSIAKLMLNSFWGTFGQNLRKSKTSFFYESEADNFFQCISDPSKTIKDFHIISDDMLQLAWEDSEDMLKEDYQTNVFIAAFITCFTWVQRAPAVILKMRPCLFNKINGCVVSPWPINSVGCELKSCSHPGSWVLNASRQSKIYPNKRSSL